MLSSITSAIMGILVKCLSPIMALILTFSGLALPTGVSYEPIDEDALIANFSVIADVHMETNNLERFPNFAKGLNDMARSKAPNDVLVLLGDNTMNGQVTEYLMLYSLFNLYNKAENTIVAMGNHDINQSENTIESAVNRHNMFYNWYTGSGNDTPYYYRVINGCYFIVLGDELGYEDTTAYISPEQLEWLGDTMEEAAASGMPIFVFSHQPFNDKFRYSVGGLGAQSEDVWNIINAYENVFFFSGHLHSSYDRFGVSQNENVTLIDLPTFLSDDNVKGVGYQVEVYPDRVELRARNFIDGEWMPKMQETIYLV